MTLYKANGGKRPSNGEIFSVISGRGREADCELGRQARRFFSVFLMRDASGFKAMQKIIILYQHVEMFAGKFRRISFDKLIKNLMFELPN